MIDKELLKILVSTVAENQVQSKNHFNKAIYHLKKCMEVKK